MRTPSYDYECLRLAEYFLAADGRKDLSAAEFACWIQDAVESWLSTRPLKAERDE